MTDSPDKLENAIRLVRHLSVAGSNVDRVLAYVPILEALEEAKERMGLQAAQLRAVARAGHWELTPWSDDVFVDEVVAGALRPKK